MGISDVDSPAFGRSSHHGERAAWNSRDDPWTVPPPFGSSGLPNPRVLGWIREATQEGSAFNSKSSQGKDLDAAIDIINGKMSSAIAPDDPEILSKLWINQDKHAAKELIAILTNPRQFWNYEANSGRSVELDKQAKIMNGCMNNWYFSTYVDLKMKGVLQYAVAHGSGFAHMFWEPDYYDRVTGEIEIESLPYDRLLPIQMPPDFNTQKCYAWLIQKQVPINRMRRMFQDHYYSIWPSSVPHQSRTSKLLKDVFRAGRKNSPQATDSPMVDVTYAYVDDYSVNRSGDIMHMGNEGFPYYYQVPSVGMALPNGNKAKPEDCFIYPYKRLIIATDDMVLYDDTSYWWHGRYPIVKFSLDEWVWDYLGHSLVMQAASAQKTSTRMSRYVEDNAALKSNPQVAFDEDVISPNEAKEWDLRIPGRNVIAKLKQGDPCKPLLPANYANLDQFTTAFIDRCDQKIDYIYGLPSLRDAMKAKQIPSSDSMEKMISSAGDIVASLSRSVERSATELGTQWRDMFFEFYTVQRRMKILGQDGITEEDFDYDPGSMVPSGEIEVYPGVFYSTRMDKARFHRQNFSYRIAPTSILKTTHTTRLLMMMQARKLSPKLIDLESLAKLLEIPNWGHLNGETVLEKAIAEMELDRKFGLQTEMLQALIQAELQRMMQGQSPEGQMAAGLGKIGDALQDAIGGGGAGPGRPNSFNKMPSIGTKDNGTRTTSPTS